VRQKGGADVTRSQAQAQGREIQPQVQAEVEDFPRLLERSKGEIAKVLPEGVSVDRVCRMALTAYKMNPGLRDCTPISILSSVMKAAELGLEPHGGLKQCWLIPFRNTEKKVKECTFQLGYQGALELARRSGQFRVIRAIMVHERDEFAFERDPRPRIFHRPALSDPGAAIGAYAYAILESGETEIEWLNVADLQKIRDTSRSADIWNVWYDEMCKKTVLKRFLKAMPQSVALATALDYDNVGLLPPGDAATPPARLSGTRSAALASRLKAIEAPTLPDVEDYEGEVEAPAEEPRRQREPGEEG
jgi:recombination protein RecT